ncbi:MAG: hypothetical protein M1546_17095 [Chloroflexi bacterium]|nr:hypothetical protein [Chloroflexota bacterium]
MMKLSHILAGALAVLGVSALSACGGNNEPLSDVSMAPAIISPNADGKDDIARLSYRVADPVNITVYLVDSAGKRYSVHQDVKRSPSPVPYELLFSGVSDGRLIPNGDYTWHIEAHGMNGTQSLSGPLKIVDADVPFPKISELTLSTYTFTPNRDAIDDHVYINVFLSQQADLTVYVIGANGFRYEVQRNEGLRKITSEGELEAGRYTYDYDGGIDLGADPPPDGEYMLVAQAEDRVGQRDVVTAPLKITDSGRPVAEIVVQPDGRSVVWSAKGEQVVRDPNDTNLMTVGLGDTLYFTMAVRNVGSVPIRTGGPFDQSDCYRMEENLYTKNFQVESGAFRVGVDYDTNNGMDHPWRWAVGTLEDVDVVEHNGQKLYYLAPGKQVLVRGCIYMTKIPVRNPMTIYASLIQEDVEILAINNHVSPLQIQIVKP